MVIAFVHNNKAFLPEIEAYVQFFSARNIRCEVVNKDEIGLVHRNVEWRLMGADLSKPKEGIYKIHEYSSSSTPPWHIWKNWSKSFMNTQPDFRLFLNPWVRKSFSFHDRIPFGYRDMGLPADWLQHSSSTAKEYDFIYVGNLSPFRKPELLLDCFSKGSMKERSILLVGNNYGMLQEKYKDSRNIIFTGPFPHSAIGAVLSKARFGINFIIDKEPLNKQTSTKLIEYAALGLPVISTRYQWMEQFQKDYGGNYFYLQPDLSNFTWEQINAFDYRQPDLQEWTWEKQIRKSGVLEFLQTNFKDLNF